MLKEAQSFSSFAVKDIAQTREFYSQTLGLRVSDDPNVPGILNLNLPSGTIVVYPKDDHAPATFTILNFLVENIEQVVDSLVAKGVSFEIYNGFDQDEKGISRDGKGPNIAWFKDSSGNILAILES